MTALRCCAAAALVAALAGAAFAQRPDTARTIEAENAVLAAEVAATGAALERARAELARLQRSEDAITAGMQRIEHRAEVRALGREFAQVMTEELSQLPRSARFAAARDARRHLLEATGDANLRVERALGRLGDLDEAVAARLAAAQVPAAERPQAVPAVRAALAGQSALLASLDGLQGELMRALRDTGDAERSLIERSEAARDELTRLLLWLPARTGREAVTELPAALAWTISPANWHAAAAILRDEVVRSPVWPTVAVLAAIGLFAARRRLQRGLVALAPVGVGYERYRIGHGLAVVAITLALALPGPILLWTAAALLAAASGAGTFPAALGHALDGTGRLLLALSALGWLLDPRGVAVRHFGWDETAVTFAARTLRRFTMLLVPLIFVAVLNGSDHAPFGNRESLGRFAFVAAMGVLVVLLAQLLGRRTPLMAPRFARAPRSLLVQLHPVWLSVLVVLPIGMGALAGAGYFVAAGFFFTKTLQSLFVVLGALVLYGLIALWVQLQRRRLVRRQDYEAPAAADGEAGEGRREAAAAKAPRLDIAAIGEQTRSLLDLLTTLLVAAGLWLVWRDTVPVMSVIGDYQLWTYTDTVDGKEVTHPLTLRGLGLAILVAVVTAAAVRNIGALLDIVLLQRLELQPDATYAIKVIARYALTAAGVLLAADILGIGWSDVQWLVAALGVGLGFGLQEIFANFVSGLIVLAERPIRIGDVVTVGDVSGTVARIRARATAVVDFDNKEVIIPNKAFITERVVNWTLSNQTTRLLLKVGVAYGSEIALVQRVLLEAVRGTPGVLESPPPSVYFVDFGDSSLDFEIRAFVGAFDQRLRVRHEVLRAVEAALRGHGIEIPFPQRDLHIRSGPEGPPGTVAGVQPGAARAAS